MSIEDSLFAALTGLVGGRVFRTVAKGQPARPYIVFQQVGGSPGDYLEGKIGAKDDGRFQFWVWHDDVDSAKAIARTLRQTLVESTTLRGRTQSGLVDVVDDLSTPVLFGTRQDISFSF